MAAALVEGQWHCDADLQIWSGAVVDLESGHRSGGVVLDMRSFGIEIDLKVLEIGRLWVVCGEGWAGFRGCHAQCKECEKHRTASLNCSAAHRLPPLEIPRGP